MQTQILLTNQEDSGEGWAVYWSGNSSTISHSMGKDYIVGILDSSDHLVETGFSITKSEDEILIDWDHQLSDTETYSIQIVNFKGDFQTSSYDLGEFYSGTVDAVMLFCRSLDLSEDKLSGFQYPRIVQMQRLVDDYIDGTLNEYYFTPLSPFNQVQLDGSVKKVFPGKIRLLAIQWVAGLLLQTQFQATETNINEQAQRFVEEAKKEIQAIIEYSTRIPGQRRKHPSPTMPPNLAPSKTNEFLL